MMRSAPPVREQAALEKLGKARWGHSRSSFIRGEQPFTFPLGCVLVPLLCLPIH